MTRPEWPELRALDLLVSVSEHGGLGAGARAVGMAQPNASRMIARWERDSGVPLLQRSPRGSTLTPQGAVVVDWARTVLSAAEDLLVGVDALRDQGVATLRVGASMTIAEYLLPAWLAELRALCPDVQVALEVTNSAHVIDEVRAGTYRLGFIESSAPPRDLHRAQVGTDDLVVVVPPAHRWAHRRLPLTAVKLAETPLVLRESGSGTRAALEASLQAIVGDLALTPPALSLSSNAAVRTAVLSGAGPGVLSRHAVAGSLGRGDLRVVPVEDLDLGRRLHALWNGPRQLNGPAGDLVTLARRSAQPATS